MKKFVVAVILLSFCLVPVTSNYAQPGEQPTMQQEEVAHPRIAAAITSLQDAIADLQAAPHNFGGHKQAAINACKKALKELRIALAYREKNDRPQ